MYDAIEVHYLIVPVLTCCCGQNIGLSTFSQFCVHEDSLPTTSKLERQAERPQQVQLCMVRRNRNPSRGINLTAYVALACDCGTVSAGFTRAYLCHELHNVVLTECEVIQEGNEISVFDDEELGVQVVELLGRRCRVAFPCSSILRYLCIHAKVNVLQRFVPQILQAQQHNKWQQLTSAVLYKF